MNQVLMTMILAILSCYGIWRILDYIYDQQQEKEKNSVESKFIKVFIKQIGGYPEISETENILKEIKNNNLPEEQWGEVIKKHQLSDEIILERYGRKRLTDG